jgi:alpha-L-arabinofuranosidase
MAITMINRDYRTPVVANIRAAGLVSSSRMLAAESAAAVNSPADPNRVVLRDLAVVTRSPGWFSATLPPHSMATIEFSSRIAGDR